MLAKLEPPPGWKGRRKTGRVLALALAGYPPATIARHVGSSYASVHATLSRLRRDGWPIPTDRETPAGKARRIEFVVPPGLAPLLEAAAARRGVKPRDLAVQIVAQTLVEDLVDAILDDKGIDR